MKKYFFLMSAVLVMASCGSNNSNSNINTPAPKEESVPLTYETAFEKAFGPRISQEPDTLALGYYLGMTKAQTSAHIKNLEQARKVQYNNYIEYYMYTMPLTHYDESGNQTDNYSFRVSTQHYKDTLQVLHLWLKATDNHHSGYALLTTKLTMEDLYKEFAPIFKAKGFLSKAVNPEATLSIDPKYGLPEAKWGGTEYRFVKDNTLIRLWRGEDWYYDYFISYYDLSVVYKEQQDIAAKEAADAKKAAEENAAREEQKKDYLRDF